MPERGTSRAGLFACGGAGLLLGIATPAAALAADWPIVADQSKASFRVRLFGLTRIEGTFDRLQGVVQTGADGQQRILASIRLDDLAMDSDRQRQWARSDEFFDAAHHPEIRFESAPLTLASLRAGEHIDGELSLRGQQRAVALWLTRIDCVDAPPAPCSAQAHASVSRARYGMTSQRAFLSDRVDLEFDLVIDRATP